MEIQRQTFGNPVNIISDRGPAFTSKKFEDYCAKQEIKHFTNNSDLPRANGKIKRVNSTIIPVFTKLALKDLTKWFKYVDDVMRMINSTFPRSISTPSFEMLVGTKMTRK